MANYKLTYKAVQDLESIWEYTVDKWSENQADKYYQMLLGAFNHLAGNPASGKHYKEISNSLMGFRAGHHIIFYSNNQTGEIEIIRILHEQMDLKTKFH